MHPTFHHIAIFLIFCQLSVLAQNRIPAFEMNERLGRGINMGNAFEAPTETAWGNPWKAEYFEIMADLEFDHVRLPVRWEPAERSMATPPYTINPAFMDRIKEVVDEALKNKLHIIVNMHHHEALFEDPEGQKERFISQWDQIATFFKDYPDSLLFEVLNEPHGNLTPELWNEFFADALGVIRQTNPERTVLLGVAEFGGLGGIAYLELPDDENIILSPHYYNPFNFTHQGAEWVGPGADEWLGTKWYDTEADRETVESEFQFALDFSEQNHIPIHVGEFGAYSKADIDSRERWTTFLARWLEELGLSWAYWEFSAGFGIYNPSSKTYNTPLVNALLHNEMPEPIPISATAIYTSNFSQGTDGWTLSTSGGAAGSINATGEKLNVNINNGGSESWHVQLVKNNIKLEKDKMYRISFKALSTDNRNGTFYAGKATDPWNAYSGYNGFSLNSADQTFIYSFTMPSPTDDAARLVFDLGKSTVGVSIYDVKVEQLSFVTIITALEDKLSEGGISVYPNPATTFLTIGGTPGNITAEIIDLNGRLISRHALHEKTSMLRLDNLMSGLYILKLSGKGVEEHLKFMKE